MNTHNKSVNRTVKKLHFCRPVTSNVGRHKTHPAYSSESSSSCPKPLLTIS